MTILRHFTIHIPTLHIEFGIATSWAFKEGGNDGHLLSSVEVHGTFILLCPTRENGCPFLLT